MPNKIIEIIFILTLPLFLLVARGGYVHAAGSPPISSRFTAQVKHAQGIHLDGRPAPEFKTACLKRYSQFIGPKAIATYNSKPNPIVIMSYLNTTIKLEKMKITQLSAFFTTRLPENLHSQGLRHIIFVLPQGTSQPLLHLQLQLNATSQCYLGSKPLGIIK
ncbi:hypothetical protein [Polycladidibacter stylochi]|uniref:hypothetical protein n=1 Tax=Polycladidibacter stylochi TaxID=1807766 RepID=UPI00082DB8DB|nr:hypothetical protein [Pseudovibrio stylochi]